MYLVIFGVGAAFIVLSLLVGEFVEVEMDVEGFSLGSFLRPTLIAIFLVVTGGMGLLIAPRVEFVGGGGLVLFVCAVSGLLVAGLVNRFILIPMHRAQNTSTFNKQDTVGTSAEVISPIPQGGYGKIRYNISGSYVTSPAKSEDGNPVPRGENVEIIYIEKNTYFVRKEAKNV
ncbi:MAG: NfeD family protein [Defluviitaleaceae bacterium]|nr:NfeD family protein [Defluviitaleaceae bacterium]MCL2262566.1 NfeD family protein [Defluviitaleaceae bacterium]